VANNKPSVSLAILNYNGRAHLEHLLPSACTEAQTYGGRCDVVVIDNRSPSNDVEWVRDKFPTVQVVVAPKNDFLFSYNWFATTTDAAILVILNNDLKLLPGFVSPLVQHFEEPDVFAVSATSRDWDNSKHTFGPIELKQHHGFYYWIPDFERQESSHTLFASGGFMAVNRLKFLEIGGFDRLFYPAYGEDLDLCFRAWQRGWRCLFEPKSVTLHRESGSWNASGGSRADRLQLRASLIFQWSSLPLACSFLERSCYLMLTSIRKLMTGNAWWLIEFTKTKLDWVKNRTKSKRKRITINQLKHLQSKIDSKNIH
jgi:N-acetylglucosaminyl-diphospho-decaprenol L-rhamnosyltransferase